MKKLLSVFVALVLVFASCVQSIAEDALSVTAQYDPVQKVVRLSGYSNGNVNIVLTEADVDVHGLDADNLPVDFFALETYGNFIYTFVMPRDASSGKYDIYLGGSSGNVKTSFMYYDGDKADDLVSQLKEKNGLSEYKKFIVDNASELGIDETDSFYTDNFENGVSLLYNCGDGFDDCKTFISALYKYLAISDMKGRTNEEISELLCDYETNLGFDYYKDFENNSDYPANVKEETLSLFSSSDYYRNFEFVKEEIADASFADVLKQMTILARVRLSESYGELQSVYEKYLSDILRSDKRYTDDRAKEVFKILIKKEFNELPDLVSNFESALDTIGMSSSDKQSSRPSGSGGGGGGSVSYPSSAPVNTAPDPLESLASDTENTDERGFTVSALLSGDVNFVDLPADHWSYKAVSSLASSGIIAGYEDGSFLPDNGITRAEFAKLMVTAFKFTGSKEKIFDDVENGAWYADFVNIAADNELINGYDGKFRPNDRIKRQDAILIAYRCAQRVGVAYSGTYDFDDIYDADSYAWPAIFSLAANKVISGDNANCVNPQSEITRAEAAQLIYGLINDVYIKLKQ